MFPADDGDERPGSVVPAGLHLASFGRRIAALLIDEIVLVLPVLAVFWLAGYPPNDAISEDLAVWFTAAGTGLSLVYETVAIWRWQQTVGKWAMGIKVVSVVDGGEIGLTRAFQRSLVPAALGAIPQVGLFLGFGVYMWAFTDRMRQGIHDKAAGSLVVGAR